MWKYTHKKTTTTNWRNENSIWEQISRKYGLTRVCISTDCKQMHVMPDRNTFHLYSFFFSSKNRLKHLYRGLYANNWYSYSMSVQSGMGIAKSALESIQNFCISVRVHFLKFSHSLINMCHSGCDGRNFKCNVPNQNMDDVGLQVEESIKRNGWSFILDPELLITQLPITMKISSCSVKIDSMCVDA